MLIKCNKRFWAGSLLLCLLVCCCCLGLPLCLVCFFFVGACAWSVVSLIASRCCVAFCVVCFAFASIVLIALIALRCFAFAWAVHSRCLVLIFRCSFSHSLHAQKENSAFSILSLNQSLLSNSISSFFFNSS